MKTKAAKQKRYRKKRNQFIHEVMEKQNYVGDLNIAGTLFKVIDGHLVQREHPENTLPLQDLGDEADRLNGYIDRYSKKLFGTAIWDLGDLINAEGFSILKSYLESRQQSMESIRALNAISVSERLSVMMVDDYLSERLNGVLPKVKLMDSWYKADLEKRTFSNLVQPNDVLHIPAKTAYCHRNYYYYYLKETHSLAPVDLQAQCLPERALLLEVPVHIDLFYIDPEFRMIARQPLEKACDHPFLWDMQLRMLPLEASNLHDIIYRNAASARKERIEHGVRVERRDREDHNPDEGRNERFSEGGFILKDLEEIKKQTEDLTAIHRISRGRGI